MLRKGTRDERGLDTRHKGTLSISVQEGMKGMARPSSQDVQAGGGQNPGTFKSPDHKLRACEGCQQHQRSKTYQ